MVGKVAGRPGNNYNGGGARTLQAFPAMASADGGETRSGLKADREGNHLDVMV